jgi:hypothetical protein
VARLRDGRAWFDSLQGEGWVPGTLPPGVKRPGHESHNSLSSSAEVKNAWRYPSTPPIRLHGAVLN